MVSTSIYFYSSRLQIVIPKYHDVKEEIKVQSKQQRGSVRKQRHPASEEPSSALRRPATLTQQRYKLRMEENTTIKKSLGFIAKIE